MKLINSRQYPAGVIQLVKHLYETSPIFVSSNLFWDGGIRPDTSLKEKAEFYALASKMACVIKELISQLQEHPLIGSDFCEYGNLYARWSDMDTYEIFRELRNTIAKNKSYTLEFPEDDAVIDLIVESNFRYFSHVSIYLPSAKAILYPSCHSEIIVYAQDGEALLTHLQHLVQKYSDETHHLRVTR